MTNNSPTLASFGCSFVFGSDLPDDGSTGFWHKPSNLTWPALLAKRTGYAYDCRAKPGSGNLQILETLSNHLATTPADIYVIGWTWIDRFDHVDESSDWWGANCTKWSTILPGSNNPVNSFYYRHLHNEYQDKFVSLMCMKTAIDLLKQKKIQFVMTYLDNLIFDCTWHTSPAVEVLQDYCRPMMQTFDGTDFLTYSKRHGYSISKSLHPLAEAHAAAADDVWPRVNNLFWLNYSHPK
jgi:hypothetical protein